ncbi:MAG: hypothetical protein KatS3mg119_2317 [Rhodothalassiaceae bacterium]|nr:MAG: hypothetical protein KatS3mg119_2317 [Rhodothalassiaceae bacterium]
MASKPDPIDVHVGSRVRLRRTLLGMSQEKLGDALGLTFQQIQKYERGANRIGASRLYKIAKILNVPVSYFYEELPDEVEASNRGLSDIAPEPFEVDQLNKRETLELVRAYYRVKDARVRKRIFELIKAIAKSDQEEA